MATLIVTNSRDYRNSALSDITGIRFDDPSSPFDSRQTATFAPGQFDDVQISSTVLFSADESDIKENWIVVDWSAAAATGFSAAGWTFENFVFFQVWLKGSDGADIIAGSSRSDFITGGGGADILGGGGGHDVFIYGSPSHLVAGESVNGGSGNDTLDLAVGNFDFSGVTLNSIEMISMDGATATFTGDQFAGITEVRGDAPGWFGACGTPPASSR